IGQEAVGLLAALVGAEVVRLLEVDGIDAGQGHEAGDVDGLGGLALQSLQLLVLDPDVLVLGELVALDEGGALHRLVAAGTERLLADARAALGVQEIEADVGRGGRRVELDRNGDQPERDRTRPNGMWRHGIDANTGFSRREGPRWPPSVVVAPRLPTFMW